MRQKGPGAAVVVALLAALPANSPAIVVQATAPPAFCEYGPAAGPGTPMGVHAVSAVYPGTTYRRDYCVHVPAGLKGRAPLVLVLHGCYTDAPTVAYESQFNQLADSKGFITVYPQQSATTAHPENPTHPYDGNGSGRGAGSGCWNWHMPDQLQRDSPEPWMLSSLTRDVMRTSRVDPRRVYVTGISGGGAMANNMAVLYPDLFAAVAIMAGCEYGGALCLGSASALPAQASGELAYQAAGAAARVVPYLVENGDIDPVVPVVNAVNLVTQWQVYDELAASGGSPASVAAVAPCAQSSQAAGSPGAPNQQDPLANPNMTHGYDVLYYSLDGSSCGASPNTLGELWIIHGELHSWPGGAARRYYNTEDSYYDIWTDPLSPDMTANAYRFFMAHPMIAPAAHGVQPVARTAAAASPAAATTIRVAARSLRTTPREL